MDHRAQATRRSTQRRGPVQARPLGDVPIVDVLPRPRPQPTRKDVLDPVHGADLCGGSHPRATTRDRVHLEWFRREGRLRYAIEVTYRAVQRGPLLDMRRDDRHVASRGESQRQVAVGPDRTPCSPGPDFLSPPQPLAGADPGDSDGDRSRLTRRGSVGRPCQQREQPAGDGGDQDSNGQPKQVVDQVSRLATASKHGHQQLDALDEECE